MLTRMEPEKPGPNTANTSSSTAFWARPLATPGLLCVSAKVTSIFWPRTPPAALISLMARSMPFLKLVPAVAPVPDSSWMEVMRMASAACVSGAARVSVRPAQAARRARRYRVLIGAVIGAVMGGLLGVSRGGWQVAQTWQTALSLHGLQVRDFSAQPQWASAVG